MFWLKNYSIWAPQTWLKVSSLICTNTVEVPTNRTGNCPEISFKISTNVVFRIVETLRSLVRDIEWFSLVNCQVVNM